MVSTEDLAWTYYCNHLMACVDRPKMLLQVIHNHVHTRLHGVLTQTTLWILTTVSISNPIPKIIKSWNINGNLFQQLTNLMHNFCFTISLFHASTCFKHMCLSSGGQNCITQPLESSQLYAIRSRNMLCKLEWY